MKKTNWRKIKKQTQETQPQTLPAVQYAGFWSRVLSLVMDIFMIGIPISLVIMSVFGRDEMNALSALDVLQGIKPLDENGLEIRPNPWLGITQISMFASVVILSWIFDKGKTPGKRLSKTKILDVKTHLSPKFWQYIVRFFAYFLSFISLIGFFLPLFHSRKMALHDVISGTIVVYDFD